MAADNYKEILEDVCEKLKSFNNIKETDISEIKDSVESIENLITDTQAKLSFQEIKEKLETISYNIDSCNEAFIKNLYNDINELKTTFENVGQHLENIQNSQNLTLTTAEFEEFQKQNLDFSLKTQESLFKELNELKSKTPVSAENLDKIQSKLETVYSTLSNCLEQITSNLKNIPNTDEIISAINNLNNTHNSNVNQTNELIKDLQTGVSNFQADLRTSNFAEQISKISAIYDSLNIVQAWIEKAGYINKSIESLYSKLGEDFNFNDVSKKVDSIHENIKDLSNLTMRIDEFNAAIDDIGNNINDKIKDSYKNILESDNFTDISDKVDIIYENISALNSWAQKLDSIEIKINSNKDDSNQNLQNISGKITEINDEISNLNELSDKVDIIYDNISELNNWTMKIDSIESKINSNKDDSNQNLQNISGKITEINDEISNLNELSDKVDIIYDNISELNNWTMKIDSIESKISKNQDSSLPELKDLPGKINTISDNISNLSDVSDKIDIIYENISALNSWAQKLDNVDSSTVQLNSKIINLTSHINDIKNINDILKNKLETIFPEDIDSSEILNKLEIIYDNISNINDWAIKIDKISETVNESNSNFPLLSDKLNEISSELHSTLSNIESDFSNLNTVLENNNQITSDDINSIKEKFVALNDDLSSISIRTNKLILNADDVNKEFKSNLEILKTTLQDFDTKINEYNPDSKIIILEQRLNKLIILMQRSLAANNNLNKAFMYLAEWIDASGKVLNGIQNNIEELKSSKSLENTDETSELKSLISAIIVQLNTSIAPNIDLVNEKIEKLEENDKKEINNFEDEIKNKIDIQSKQISSLEEKLDSLNEKFDKLIEAVNIDNKNSDVKDIMNYVVTQVSEVNENIKNIKTDSETLKTIEEKIVSFDTNVNKIVSYIEEE